MRMDAWMQQSAAAAADDVAADVAAAAAAAAHLGFTAVVCVVGNFHNRFSKTKTKQMVLGTP